MERSSRRRACTEPGTAPFFNALDTHRSEEKARMLCRTSIQLLTISIVVPMVRATAWSIIASSIELGGAKSDRLIVPMMRFWVKLQRMDDVSVQYGLQLDVPDRWMNCLLVSRHRIQPPLSYFTYSRNDSDCKYLRNDRRCEHRFF
jgi:hypothetical protein